MMLSSGKVDLDRGLDEQGLCVLLSSGKVDIDRGLDEQGVCVCVLLSSGEIDLDRGLDLRGAGRAVVEVLGTLTARVEVAAGEIKLLHRLRVTHLASERPLQ